MWSWEGGHWVSHFIYIESNIYNDTNTCKQLVSYASNISAYKHNETHCFSTVAGNVTIIIILYFNQFLHRFDGEFVNFKETAADLALEGGELMDFFQKK